MRLVRLSLLLAACTAPATANPPAPAPVARLEGLAYTPIRAASPKRGEAPAKPRSPVEYKPVDVALHFHVDADGNMLLGCKESHPQPAKQREDAR